MATGMTGMIGLYTPPGLKAGYETLLAGRQLRDKELDKFPIIPGAVKNFKEMVAGREWRISGATASGVSRAIEWINAAQSVQYDGIVDFGFQQYLSRRALDHVTIGRVAFSFKVGQPLRYLDASNLFYDIDKQVWTDRWTNEDFKINEIMVSTPYPVGLSGGFASPLLPIVPTAQLAWLIRAHDRASADGTKMKDITIVSSEVLAKKLGTAMSESLDQYNKGFDPTKHKVAIAWTDKPGKVSEQFGRLGLANIPEGFDRVLFQDTYVNEIAGALGMSVNNFWSKTQGTNRALEQVQDARQTQKGPAFLVRSEQRWLNESGALKQFGPTIQFEFVEAVDTVNRKANAEIIFIMAKAFTELTKATGGKGSIDLEAVNTWFKRVGMLPLDLDIIVPGVSDEESDDPDTDTNDIDTEEFIEKFDEFNEPIIAEGKSSQNNSVKKPLKYGYICMSGSGEVIETRRKYFNAVAIIAEDELPRANAIKFVEENAVTYKKSLIEAREKNAKKFFDLDWKDNEEATAIKEVDKSKLTEQNYREIGTLLRSLE